MLHTIALDVPDAPYRSDSEAIGDALVADVSDASWSIEDASAALAVDSEDPGFERPLQPERDLQAWQAWAADFARSRPGRHAQTLGRLLLQATVVCVGEHYRVSREGRTRGYDDLFADEEVEVLGGSYSGLDPAGYRDTFDKLRARLDGLARAGSRHDVWVAGIFFRWEFEKEESPAERIFTPLGRKTRRRVSMAPLSVEDLREELEEMGYDEDEVDEVLEEVAKKKRRRRK